MTTTKTDTCKKLQGTAFFFPLVFNTMAHTELIPDGSFDGIIADSTEATFSDGRTVGALEVLDDTPNVAQLRC